MEGIFKGKMVKAVKIGNTKNLTNRLTSLNIAVYENFDFHSGNQMDDVVTLNEIAKNDIILSGGCYKERNACNSVQ